MLQTGPGSATAPTATAYNSLAAMRAAALGLVVALVVMLSA